MFILDITLEFIQRNNRAAAVTLSGALGVRWIQCEPLWSLPKQLQLASQPECNHAHRATEHSSSPPTFNAEHRRAMVRSATWHPEQVGAAPFTPVAARSPTNHAVARTAPSTQRSPSTRAVHQDGPHLLTPPGRGALVPPAFNAHRRQARPLSASSPSARSGRHAAATPVAAAQQTKASETPGTSTAEARARRVSLSGGPTITPVDVERHANRKAQVNNWAVAEVADATRDEWDPAGYLREPNEYVMCCLLERVVLSFMF